ncbi:MAG: hypothetical protein JXQ84_06305, partial [Rhodospirillaceae bacterium]|nr:hypothetical protein [Rhodospirillaceae bacterium]
GWLVAPGDPGDLAAAIATALDASPSVRTRMAEQCQTRVREIYSRQQMCDRTLDVYAELLDGAESDAFLR